MASKPVREAGHVVLVVSREHREDLIVGAGQARSLQAPVQVRDELMMGVHEGSPGAVFHEGSASSVPSAAMLPRLVDASSISAYG